MANRGNYAIFNVIGGTGTLVGPIVGAAFFLLLREGLSRFFTEYYLITVGVIFVAAAALTLARIQGAAKGLEAATDGCRKPGLRYFNSASRCCKTADLRRR